MFLVMLKHPMLAGSIGYFDGRIPLPVKPPDNYKINVTPCGEIPGHLGYGNQVASAADVLLFPICAIYGPCNRLVIPVVEALNTTPSKQYSARCWEDEIIDAVNNYYDEQADKMATSYESENASVS